MIFFFDVGSTTAKKTLEGSFWTPLKSSWKTIMQKKKNFEKYVSKILVYFLKNKLKIIDKAVLSVKTP